MGTLRLLLAMAVVNGHIGHAFFRNGAGIAAVEAFFMISGFYIAMVLDTSYNDSRSAFWINRALRLYPAYLSVAVVALAFKLCADPQFIAGFRSLPGTAQAVLVASNALLLGQDWVMFLGVLNGHLTPVADFRAADPQLWNFLLLPPAWSLGVELTFYALAPFLFKVQTRVLICVVIASIVLRLLLAKAGLFRDPWTYRFFPSELAMFVIGGLGYRAMGFFNLTPSARVTHIAVAVMGAYLLVLYGYIPGPGVAKRCAFLVAVAVLVPLLFRASQGNKIDRFVGELSYPLYISHWLTLDILRYFFGPDVGADAASAAGAAFGCIAVAVVLSLAVDEPVQRIRAKVRARNASPITPATSPVVVN